MQTRATIRGYPLHPFLVMFPIAFYVAGWAMLVAFSLGASPWWYQASYVSLLVGGGLAVISAVIGALDLTRVPQDIRAKRIGFVHGAVDVGATLLFVSAGLVMHTDWVAQGRYGSLEIGLPLVLGTLALALMSVGGALGVRLVSSEHVGFSPIAGGRVRLGTDAAPVRALGALDAITVIKEQHDRIETIFQSLQVAPSRLRRDLYIELCNVLEAHAEMEETIFYRSFALPDGKHLTSYAQDHREVRRLLSTYGHDCDDDSQFLDHVLYLHAVIGAHQAQEERELLPLVAAKLSASERQVLGSEMRAFFDQIVTHGAHRKIEPQSRHTAHV
jgi:uncharacterized membrane protein/hemerythrin superfamily protein